MTYLSEFPPSPFDEANSSSEASYRDEVSTLLKSPWHESEIEGRRRRIREASMSRKKGWVNEAASCDRVDMRNVQGCPLIILYFVFMHYVCC